MKKVWLVLAATTATTATLSLFACGDDSIFSTDGGPSADGSSFDAGATDAFRPNPGTDAWTDSSTPPPPRMLVSYNGSASTEMVAFNLQTNMVDGRLEVPSFLGATYVGGGAPFFLAQATDQVLKLDGQEPWKVVSSWDVSGSDKAAEGGVMDSYADPDTVAVAAGSKAYVLRYTRTKIDVIDTSQVVDGGAPMKTIDLTSLIDPGDSDGVPDMTAAVYHAGRQRLYVLLGNVDKNQFDYKFMTNALICSGHSSSVIAIDTTTDTVVSLNGTAQGGGIKLPGYNPPVGVKMAYDSTNDRLLVINAGCNANVDAGAAVNLQQREVDEVKLDTGTADKVLDLNTPSFYYPSGLFLLDATHAIVGTYGGTFLWNPSGTVLGPQIMNAPDFFTIDTSGNLVGTQQSYFTDGGSGPVNLVRVTTDGGSTVLGSGVETIKGPSFVGGVDVWPSN